MTARWLAGALLVATGCGGAEAGEAGYLATFHDRVGACEELRGTGSDEPLPLVLTREGGVAVSLAAPERDLYGVELGSWIVVGEVEERTWSDAACPEWEWSYRVDLTARVTASLDLTGSARVSALSTCVTTDGRVWEYPFEEEWQFDAEYIGAPPEGHLDVWQSLYDIVDAGYCL